jgi:hypothetical protein
MGGWLVELVLSPFHSQGCKMENSPLTKDKKWEIRSQGNRKTVIKIDRTEGSFIVTLKSRK